MNSSFKVTLTSTVTKLCKAFTTLGKGSKQVRPYSEVDPRILPLVKRMNATGVIETIASCEGHAKFGFPPYVYFKAPTNIASSIERALRDNDISEGGKFHSSWVLTGHFDNDFDLTFRLASPEHDGRALAGFSHWYFWFFRHSVDADLLALCQVVEKIELADHAAHG